MLSQPSASQTKAQILDACEQIWNEYKAVENKLKAAEKKNAALESELARAKQARPGGISESPAKPVQANAPKSFRQMIEQFDIVESGLSPVVSDLSANLVAESTKLRELQNVIKNEITEAEALYEVQIDANTLNNQLSNYQEIMNAFEQELLQKKTDFEIEFARKTKAWQKEQAEYSQGIRERDEQSKDALKREAEEYKYNLELKRKLEVEKYIQQQNQLRKELVRFEDEKRREWNERETKLAEQEKEIAEAQKRVENFPKELDAAVKKARDNAREKAQKAAKIQTNLEAKKVEGEKRIAELKIKSLESEITEQNAQIETLSQKLDAALRQAQDLATKAIEGASNLDSLKAMKQIALEQAKKIVQSK